jgi:hypothetical protein
MHKVLFKFLEQTKFTNLSTADAENNVPAPPQDSDISGVETTDLPSPKSVTVSSTPLRQAMENRRSRRAFLDQELNLEQLSWLLWVCQGVQKNKPIPLSAWFLPPGPGIPWILTW